MNAFENLNKKPGDNTSLQTDSSSVFPEIQGLVADHITGEISDAEYQQQLDDLNPRPDFVRMLGK